MATNTLRNLSSIMEQGTSGIWTYRKWSDGTAECWGTSTTTGTFAAWGNGYSHDVSRVAFPTDLFISRPLTVAQSITNGVSYVTSISANLGDKDYAPQVICFRPNSPGSGTYTFETNYYAIGKWK